MLEEIFRFKCQAARVRCNTSLFVTSDFGLLGYLDKIITSHPYPFRKSGLAGQAKQNKEKQRETIGRRSLLLTLDVTYVQTVAANWRVFRRWKKKRGRK